MKPETRSNILQFFTFTLVIFSTNVSAQMNLSKITIETGVTLMDWDGIFDNRPSNYDAKRGYFIGAGIQVIQSKNLDKRLGINLKYRLTDTEYASNFERIKLSELTLTLGPSIDWRKLNLGLNGSLIYIISKEKIDNTPLTGIDLKGVEDFYLSFSGKVSFNVSQSLYIFVEQAIINTKVYHTYKIERGERYEVPSYPGWTLIGAGYNF